MPIPGTWSAAKRQQLHPRGRGARHSECVSVIIITSSAEQHRGAIVKNSDGVLRPCTWSIT